MMRRLASVAGLAIALVVTAAWLQPVAHAGRWEVRKEIREGSREVRREKREARRELARCETRACARREVREGYREVQQERREARREVRRALRDYDDDRDDGGKDLLKGLAIGAAVIGIATVISNASQTED